MPYTYVVKNTGNVTLTGVTLSDDKVARRHQLYAIAARDVGSQCDDELLR